MPHHTGVLVASLLLFAGLGVNMVIFPEVWSMFRDDSLASTERASHKNVAPVSAPNGDERKDTVKSAKPMSIDRPIPIDPPLSPKKDDPKPAPTLETPPKKDEPKQAPAPETLLKKDEPKPAPALETPPKKDEPKPAPVPETPPKKDEPKQAPAPETLPKKDEPKQAPAPETPPKKEEPPPRPAISAPAGKKTDAEVRAAAFAPIIPQELLESEQMESLLPTMESIGTTSESVKKPTPDVAVPAYAEEFPSAPKAPPSRSLPVFETLDSALASPIRYESHPTIEQRALESSVKRIAPPTVSPTGAVKRLPTAE